MRTDSIVFPWVKTNVVDGQSSTMFIVWNPFCFKQGFLKIYAPLYMYKHVEIIKIQLKGLWNLNNVAFNNACYKIIHSCVT